MDNTALTTEILLSAYSQGYFPMPDPETEQMLWYRPDPRAIFPLDGFHVSKSLSRTIRRNEFSVTYSTHFHEVMLGCADREDTWINDEIFRAYGVLHREGFAQSVEVWKDQILVGGAYGVSLRGGFFAESMFHKATNASKVALFFLMEKLKSDGFILFECQFMTEHLASLGAVEINDSDYTGKLEIAMKTETALFSTEDLTTPDLN